MVGILPSRPKFHFYRSTCYNTIRYPVFNVDTVQARNPAFLAFFPRIDGGM